MHDLRAPTAAIAPTLVLPGVTIRKNTRDIGNNVGLRTDHHGGGYLRSQQSATDKPFRYTVCASVADRPLPPNPTCLDTIYRNLQAQTIETQADGTFNDHLTIVGRLGTRGVERETSLRPVDHLGLAGAVTYTDATCMLSPPRNAVRSRPRCWAAPTRRVAGI